MRQREPRLLDPGYLAFVRAKPCTTCRAAPPSQAAHIRIGFFGKGMKPHDKDAVPLCQWCHIDGPKAQHKMNETEFWAMWNLNPFEIAAKLYFEYGGTGGAPKKQRTIIRPRLPKDKRQKIQGRSQWPKRRFENATKKS